MAYQSKYTGLQIDDILDSVEWKQGKIEDLASIRAGAAKGATALQSYTEKYTGTVTGIKINGVVKSGSGVIDLGTISTDISGKQDKLVDGVNIATINGQSLTEGGDLTIESGAKVYKWFYNAEAESVTLSQEEYDNIVEADLVIINIGVLSFTVSKSGKELSEAVGAYALIGQFDMQESKYTCNIHIDIATKLATFTAEEQNIPTKTSQLENDSDFVTPEDVAAVALSGSYNDLHDAPTIPSAVTESTVSGWGFTKNAGTITGVKINGTTKNPSSGVVDLGTVITDVSNLVSKDFTGELVTVQTQALQGGRLVYALPDQANGDEDDVLLSRGSVKTINGESIEGSGDITIEGGAKIYELDLTDRGNPEGYITEEEWNIIKDSDRIKIITNTFSTEIVQMYSPLANSIGDVAFFGSVTSIQGGVTTNYVFGGANATGVSPYSYLISEVFIPTKTSQLENDSNFITSDGLKTINGESILGSGDITIEGGESYDDSEIREAISQLSAITDDFNSDIANLYNIKQDTLVSGTNIKTINGTSILGSGNITISGGGNGGGSSAYSEVNHGTSDTTFALTPNTFHIWDEVSALTLTLGSETSGVANEFLFQFTSGATATSLTLPDDIKWANDTPPTIAENMIYQVSILKGLASVLEFSSQAPSVPIVFYVNDTPYDAMSNMTWNDFINSDYNTNVPHTVDKWFIDKDGCPAYAMLYDGEVDIYLILVRTSGGAPTLGDKIQNCLYYIAS